MEIYKDPSKTVEERVEDLLSRMTLEEKAAQLCGDLPMQFMNCHDISGRLREKYPDGHGRFTQFSTMGLRDPVELAQMVNRMQHYFVEETRLGIPVAIQSENLCGYPGADGTLFPSQVNVGSTWDPALVYEMAKVIGQESRAVGINAAMSPVIDVSRDPRWGRTYECYGEDPYLVSRMGVAYVQGMQDEKRGPACIAKHFLGYADSQAGLNTAVCRINDRELYETFATPFEAAMREADVSGVMANYGEIDGMNVVANPKIATELLRDTMQFQGMLTSDGAGILRTWSDYHTAASYEEAGYLAKRAGTDTEIPVGGAFAALPAYVRSGQLSEDCLDESVRRILTIKFAYGLFENPYVDIERIRESLNDEKKSGLSEEIARKSLILLKNHGVLPLKKGLRLALVGPHADSLRYPVSGYTYPAYIEMINAANEDKKISMGGIGDEAAKATEEKKAASPFAALAEAAGGESLPEMNQVLRAMGARTLREILSERFELRYAEGCDLMGEDESGFPEALAVANESDLVIMACGGSCGWTNCTGGEGIDRCHLGLPGKQEKLLEALLATKKPVVLILYGPQIFSLPWAKDRLAAVIEAYMPGQFAAKAVADVLDGTCNPGGKLTVTIPRSVGQIPNNYNHRQGSGYPMGDRSAISFFSGGYADESNEPLYYFGHGLSYTTFAIDNFQLESDRVPTDGKILVSCDVTNSGDREGDEVLQLYYHTKRAHVIRPVMQLAGFCRIHLEAGEKKRIKFSLDTAQLGYYNEDMNFVVEETEMDLMIGTAADRIAWKKEISLVGPGRNLMGKRSYQCKVEIS